jgi:protein involved in polysaccharide export with SLBB domain
MESATTVMDLIARAGGVTADKGNVAYILRENLEEKRPLVIPLLGSRSGLTFINFLIKVTSATT